LHANFRQGMAMTNTLSYQHSIQENKCINSRVHS